MARRHGQQLIGLAEAGDVEIATVISIREHEYACEDHVAQRIRQETPGPEAER